MSDRFTSKRCTVDELLQHRTLFDELADGQALPGLQAAAQKYAELEEEGAVRCALLLDGTEAVGFFIVRLAQASTAVLDTAPARHIWTPDLCKELGLLVFSEAKSMAEDMGAAGLRIPHEASGPASAVLSGTEATATGTNFFQAFAAGSKYEHDAQHA